MGKYEVFKSKNEWYFRLKAANGEIIASSEGYKRKAGALKGIASFKKNAMSDIYILDYELKVEEVIREKKRFIDKILELFKK